MVRHGFALILVTALSLTSLPSTAAEKPKAPAGTPQFLLFGMQPAGNYNVLQNGANNGSAVASPLEVGAGDAPALVERLHTALAASGVAAEFIVAPPTLDPASAVANGRLFYDARVDVICVIAASWFEDYLVLDLLEECDVPVILWARPGMETGALCGVQQLGFMLKQLDKPTCFLFAEPEEPDQADRALDFACQMAGRNLTPSEWTSYLPDLGTHRQTCPSV